jgi:hypothetical protein
MNCASTHTSAIRAVVDYDSEDIVFGMEEHTIFVVEARLKVMF